MLTETTDSIFECAECGKLVGRNEVFRKSFLWTSRARPREETFCSTACIAAFIEKKEPLPMTEQKITEARATPNFTSGAPTF